MQVADLEECPTLEPELKNFILVQNKDEVFVIWDWQWSDHSNTLIPIDDEDGPDEVTVIPETPPESDDDSDANDESTEEASPHEIEHTVTFKCIGCTKEQPYQQALIRAAQLRREGNNIEVKVEPEPTNPFDAKAIQVICKVDGGVEKDRLFGVRSS